MMDDIDDAESPPPLVDTSELAASSTGSSAKVPISIITGTVPVKQFASIRYLGLISRQAI